MGAMGARWRLSTARPSGGGWRSPARVGKLVWCLKVLIERSQSLTESKGDELMGRCGAGMAEVGCPRRAGTAGVKAGGVAVGLGSGVGEMAKAQEEWFAGVLVVLMRAGVKALGFCNELSTAVTMWRQAVAREVVVRAEEGSKEGEQGWGRERATRGGRSSRRWSGGGSTAATGRCSAPAAGSSRGAEGARGRRKEGGVRRTYVQN
jgi:hypothetical protein